MAQTFLWHDYETFGAQPTRDRPAQFAGIRTDARLNETDAPPLLLYCQPARDTLPDPESCLITGITPQDCAARGVPEHTFAHHVAQALGEPGTIGVGYNSMRFDSVVTRFLFWRNLIDPYAHEWQNDCSRWDLIDVMRCAHALRPEGITWPTGDDGLPSFRLEKLSAANGLAHEHAHDALSDVRATIALARLLREKQPRLFDFCLTLRDKHQVMRELGLPVSIRDAQPFLHISSRFGAARGCLAVMAPLAMHPTNKNELLAWDLCADPAELADLKPDAVRARLFTAVASLPEGLTRLPIKSVHLNKSPIVIRNIRTLNAAQAARWQIDLGAAERHLQHLRALPDLSALWAEVYKRRDADVDVDESLYGGGFISNADRWRLTQLRGMDPQELALSATGFDDPRLSELVWRYRARNFPQTLNAEETARWQAHCRARLIDGAGGARTLAAYFDSIDQLAQTRPDEPDQAVLGALRRWGESIAPQ